MAVIVTVTQVCAGPAESDIKLNLPSYMLHLILVILKKKKKLISDYKFGTYFKANIWKLHDSAL